MDEKTTPLLRALLMVIAEAFFTAIGIAKASTNLRAFLVLTHAVSRALFSINGWKTQTATAGFVDDCNCGLFAHYCTVYLLGEGV